MSCNGCRALRKGCSNSCMLRPSLEWIVSHQAQGHATLFVAKFFGRSDLMAFLSAVPDHRKPALFQSLLFESCGRTINPVSGAVGLLSSGNWHLCKQAVDTVLSGGSLRPLPESFITPLNVYQPTTVPFMARTGGNGRRGEASAMTSFSSGLSSSAAALANGETKVLNLFVG